MYKIINFLRLFLLSKTVDNIHFLYNYTIDKKLKRKYIMKNNNKTLKRLTATFLTAISVFNFTVPGKAEVVNFQQGGSIRYGKENNKIISAKDLEEIREKIATEFNATKLGREYIDKLTDYNTRNFIAKNSISNNIPEHDIGEYIEYYADKEFVFEYSSIKDVYIIYSVNGSIEKRQQEDVGRDKGKYFNQFDPEHEDSIFLVIAPDAEWEKMEEIYKKEDVQNKFIRFGRIVDTNETVNLTREVGIPNTQKTKTIISDVSVRKINFIDPTSPQQQLQQPQPMQPIEPIKPTEQVVVAQNQPVNQPNDGTQTNSPKTKGKKIPKPLTIAGIVVACLLAIPVVGTAIKWGINKFSNHKKIPKHNI